MKKLFVLLVLIASLSILFSLNFCNELQWGVTPLPTISVGEIARPFIVNMDASTPANGTSEVSPTLSEIVLVFNDAVGANGTYTIYTDPEDADQPTLGSGTIAGSTITIPISGLTCDTGYYIMISGVTDADGNEMEPATLIFATLGTGGEPTYDSTNLSGMNTIENYESAMAGFVPSCASLFVLPFFEPIQDVADADITLDNGATATVVQTLGQMVVVAVSGLACGQAYSLTIQNITSMCGVTWAGSTVHSFNTIPDDTVAPVFAASSYDSNAQVVTFTFGEVVDCTDADITFSSNATGKLFNSTAVTNECLVMLTNEIACNQTYTVTINNVPDTCGNTLTTEESYDVNIGNDTEAPVLFTTSPEDGELLQPVYSSGSDYYTYVYAYFTTTGINQSLYENYITINNNAYVDSIWYSGAVDFDGTDYYRYGFYLYGLEPNESYTMTIANVEDNCGNVMSGSTTLTFQTVEE